MGSSNNSDGLTAAAAMDHQTNFTSQRFLEAPRHQRIVVGTRQEEGGVLSLQDGGLCKEAIQGGAHPCRDNGWG